MVEYNYENFPVGWDKKPYHTWYGVPAKFHKFVCICKEEGGYGNNVVPSCGRCGKMKRYLLRDCVSCGTTFMKCFSHPQWCILHPLCWDCLEKPVEPCRCNKLLPKKIAPAFALPREFAAEELVDVFDFDSPL